MAPPAQARPRLLATVLSRASLARCVPIAIVVGTVLSLVNQGSVIVLGDADAAALARVAVNYACRSACPAPDSSAADGPLGGAIGC